MTTVAAPFDLAAWGQFADEEIVTRIRTGDTALYEILMRRYNQRIYRIVRAILRNDAEAEDVMQEAYVRAYQHLAEFSGKAKFSTWLTRIAIYEAFDRRRKLGRAGGQASVPDASSDFENTMRSNERDPEAHAYDRELRSVLENAVDALPESYRCVFVLRVVEGLDVNDTAAALDLGVETVKTRLHRGRAILRKTLEQRAGIVAAQIFPFHAPRCDRVVNGVFRRIEKNSQQL
ncbi:MAG TPA: RNA polymerase sigma factor [Bryobacteraceae bacterium]|nr:RNA polymerase sigma factor [Bryobacteraceae bacterium]